MRRARPCPTMTHGRGGRLSLSALAAVLAAACATEEYRSAAHECRGPALQAYPVVMQQHMFKRSREVMVPDGSTVCETTEVSARDKRLGVSQTQSFCRPGMRKVIEYYDEPGMIDIHAGSREAYVSQCARDLCQKRYGNLDCKVKK